MERLVEIDLQIDYYSSPEAVVPDALSHRPDYGDCKGDILSHTILTLEAHCSTLVMELSFLHHLNSK